jgi:UDP-N-acetylmuramoyl-tripeptide--D-alanyl-D-alanine ligase
VLDCVTVSGRNSWSYLALGILRLERYAKFAAFEVAIARAGQMRRYARLVKPDVTVVTSVGSEHLISMKSLEGIRREKSEMVAAVDPGGVVVLNGDDPNVAWMKSRTRAKVVTYGFGEKNTVRASDCSIIWPSGTRFRVHTDSGSWEVQFPLIGKTMVYAALAAIAVGISQGIQMETILIRFEGLKPSTGRLEPVRLSSGAWALRDDHKSGIETIHAAIGTLKEIDAPRRIAVLGDITEEIGSVRPIYRDLGAQLGEIVDLLLLTGRYARSVGVGARRAGMASESVIDCRKDIFKAIEILGAYLKSGDVVLLKGRYEQRLRRVALALAGETVNCRLSKCEVKGLHCESCSALANGWPPGVTEI